MARVLIVVGHREGSQGAAHAGVTEWAWNTPVAHLVAEELAQFGHDAQVVFRDNVRGGYSKLPAKLNTMGADIIACLHLNAAGPRATGSETLCWHRSHRGQRLADYVQTAMVDALGLPDRGTKRRGFEVVNRDGSVVRRGPLGRREAGAWVDESGRDFRIRYQRGGPVLHQTTAVTIIVEPGFITSEADMSALNSRRGAYVSAVAAGIDRFASE